MIRSAVQSTLVRSTLVLLLGLGVCPPVCVPTTQPMNGNSNGSNANSNGNTQENSNSVAGAGFSAINGTELLVEGARDNQPNGESRRRDERFTAAYSLRPTSAESRQIVINFDQFTTAISGDIAGTARLTYEESGTDVTPELTCPTTTYSGMVEWEVEVTGSYDYVPALGTIMLTTRATNVSSPQYTVSFTTPGCPDQDSTNPAQYNWQGPGQGVWGFVDIVLVNGLFTDRLENPLGEDLGATDFYEIQLSTGP